jgi:hypothetical protein
MVGCNFEKVAVKLVDPGCLSQIMVRIFTSRIQSQKSLGPGSAFKKYFNPNNCFGLSEMFRIWIFTHPGSRAKKVYRIPDPQHLVKLNRGSTGQISKTRTLPFSLDKRNNGNKTEVLKRFER